MTTVEDARNAYAAETNAISAEFAQATQHARTARDLRDAASDAQYEAEYNAAYEKRKQLLNNALAALNAELGLTDYE